MKKKNEIIKKYKNNIKNLKNYNHLYFNKDKPKISDFAYDKLKAETLEMEKSYKYLKNLNLILDKVGSPPTNKFKKIYHLKPMLSLSNAFDKSDMIDFLKKIKT